MVSMTIGRLFVVLLGFAALGALGCAGRPATPQPVAALTIDAHPINAGVFIDDRRVGSAESIAGAPIRLRTGAHFISVSAPGYFPHDERVELHEGSHAMQIQLVPIPP